MNLERHFRFTYKIYIRNKHIIVALYLWQISPPKKPSLRDDYNIVCEQMYFICTKYNLKVAKFLISSSYPHEINACHCLFVSIRLYLSLLTLKISLLWIYTYIIYKMLYLGWDCGGHFSTVNSLSCSSNQFEMIQALWHGALSCWK